MNSMWSQEKSRLHVETMGGMIVLRKIVSWNVRSFMISYWKTEICCVRLLHRRNIHGMILVKYSPPLHPPKFLYGFRHWRIMVSSITRFLSSYLFMNTEYYITPVPLLPSQCPVFVSRKYGQPTFSTQLRLIAEWKWVWLLIPEQWNRKREMMGSGADSYTPLYSPAQHPSRFLLFVLAGQGRTTFFFLCAEYKCFETCFRLLYEKLDTSNRMLSTAVVFNLFCSRTPRYNISSTLYPQSCWCIIQVIYSL
jgi:hypothetical protein